MSYENLDPFDDSFRGFLKWRMNRVAPLWPKWVDFPPQEAPPARVEGSRLRATFINHASLLIQQRGLNLLTDPVYSKRCSPFEFVGPARVHAPGVAEAALPRLHAILLSHNHYDHMDKAALVRLSRAHQCPIYTGLGVSGALPRETRAQCVEMDWWDSLKLSSGLSLHYVPTQHFSARGAFDRMKTRWGGFVLESPSGHLYFAGDTGWGRHFSLVQERFGSFRLALLPIGAYEPRWFMKKAHMNPEEAVRAKQALRADKALAYHFGCFPLTDEPYEAPLEALYAARADAGVSPEDFRALAPGQAWELP